MIVKTANKLEGVKQLALWNDEPGRYTYIFISGKAGVGKTTVANLMKDHLEKLGYYAVITPLAKEVKRCAREYFGWDGNKDEKGRKLLQGIGTDVGREYDPDNWVKRLVNSIYEGMFHPDFVIVDDWRFPNELSYVENLDQYNTVAVRVDATKREILRGTPEEDHLSEISLPDPKEGNKYYDFVIFNNDASLNNLKEMAEKLIDILLERNKKND